MNFYMYMFVRTSQDIVEQTDAQNRFNKNKTYLVNHQHTSFILEI